LALLGALETDVLDLLRTQRFLGKIATEEPYEGRTVRDRLVPEVRRQFDLLIAVRSGSADTLSDRPATSDSDALERKVFAEVLASRIRRLHSIDSKAPLVVHLDGPWGSGKSSIINLLTEVLVQPSPASSEKPSGPWLVLPYNAWRQQRIEVPWWTLAVLITHEGGKSLLRRGLWPAWLQLRFRHFWFKTVAGRARIVLAALVAVAIGFALYALPVEPPKEGAVGTTSTKILKEVLSAAGVVFGAALAIFNFLTATDASARAFLRSRPDPVSKLVEHIQSLLQLIGRPVAIMVDDIDRCEPTSVVRLLEGIHTVFGDLPIVFVVAGDGRWIGRAFEKAYADASAARPNSAAKPLGSLFLEKLFQFSAAVPEIPDSVRRRFWKQLLQLHDRSTPGTGEPPPDFANLKSEEAILLALGEAETTEPSAARGHAEAVGT
jgi:energy-coupling factor transporter ATP-binding protein EcfA2